MPLALQCSNPAVQVRLARAEGLGHESAEFTAATGLPRRRESGRRLGAGEIDGLVERYKAGSSAGALAVEYGIHRSTVVLHLRRQGIPPIIQPALSDEDVIEAAKLYDEGMSLGAIARQLERSATTIRRRLLAAGVPMRS